MLASLLASLVLAPLLPAAQIVDSVTPASGAFGSKLVIAGSGFGPKKAKAFLVAEDDGKTRRLKVLEWTDTEILVELRKLPAGAHALNVQLKGKGHEPAAAPDPVTVELPSDAQFSPDTAGPGEEVSMTAHGLGTKKGAIKVGGVKAKVVSWVAAAPGDGEGVGMVVFKPGKKTPPGLQSVSVKTTAGEAVLAELLEVSEPDPGGGGPGIPGNPYGFDHGGLQFVIDGSPTPVVFGAPAKTQVFQGQTTYKLFSQNPDFSQLEIHVDWFHDQPTSVNKTATLHQPKVDITYRTLSAIWSTTSNPALSDVLPGASATITVTGPAVNIFGTSFGGAFSGTLVLTEGTGAATLTVSDGFFWSQFGQG